MAANAINPATTASILALKNSVASTPTVQKTVVTQYTTTSISGQTTTVTTYSDGSSTTTVTEGDTVILSSKKSA